MNGNSRMMLESCRKALALCLGMLGLAMSLGLAQPVLAQESPLLPPVDAQDVRIQRLNIQVMPEFDDPRVLVIAQGRVDLGGEAKTQITLRLPSSAQINQMATMNASTGAITSRPFDTVPDESDGRWQLVSYELDSAHFFYEYYYDAPTGEAEKAFSYVYSSLQPIDDLMIEVQQPLAATDFNLNPPASATRQDANFGFTYHQINVGALEPDAEFSVDVSYTKTDPEPSLSRQEVASMQAEPPPADLAPTPASPAIQITETAQESPQPSLLYALAGAFVVAVVGVVVLRNRNRPQQPSGPQTRPSAKSSSPSTTDVFCRQCGATLNERSNYCHICGSPVYQEGDS